MNNTQHLDTVLRPVTTFLDEALGRVDASRVLSETAQPLIRAIEAVPGAGRVAVFLNGGIVGPLFVSGPSFEIHEVEALSALIADIPTAPPMRSVETRALSDESELHRVRLFPLRVSGEQPAALLVTVRDPADQEDYSVFDTFMDQIAQIAGIIVEDRRLRSKMTDQQSVLEALLGAAPDAIIRINRSGTILDFLGSASRLFGWRAEEIVGKSLTILMPEPHSARHGNYIDAFLQTGERRLPDFGRRLQACHKTGKTFPIEIALNQLPGREDVEFIGIVRDISHRVARETEIDALREALDAAALQSALGEFASIIAHELNQPLTAIANYMDALELRLASPSPENLDTAMELAKRSGAQARLGGKVIARTRRMALRGETEPRMDSFHDAVAETMSMMAHGPAAKGVMIRYRQEGTDSPSLFDRVQIQQIVMNLSSNALRAMAGMDRAELTVTSRQTEDTLELVVRDTGPGIAEVDRPKIFERFFRRSKSGMGLGLSIVRRIANAHGGDIRLTDSIGSGAEFTLTLPRRIV